MPAVVGLGDECFPNVVGENGDGSSRAAVDRRGPDRCLDLRRVGGTHDGIVHQHDVELSAEAQRPHVALEVLALRIDGPTHGQHSGRPVSQGQPVVTLEVKGEAPAAGPEL